MIDILARFWMLFLAGALWLIDAFCDACADLFTWLLYNLIFRWMGGDDG